MQEIQLYLPGILLAYAAFLLALASPGPNVLAVIGTSMNASRASGLSLAMGVAIGSFTWALLTVFGLSALLASYASALLAIKIFGGVYLLYLAYKSFKSAASDHYIAALAVTGKPRSASGYFKRGYIVQMTNPKAALSWIAIISLGLQEGAPWWVAAAIVVGTFILSIGIHALYAIAFSTPAMVRLYGKSRRAIQGVLGTFFAFAGLRLLTSRG
jgi:amino acid exporter